MHTNRISDCVITLLILAVRSRLHSSAVHFPLPVSLGTTPNHPTPSSREGNYILCVLPTCCLQKLCDKDTLFEDGNIAQNLPVFCTTFFLLLPNVLTFYRKPYSTSIEMYIVLHYIRYRNEHFMIYTCMVKPSMMKLGLLF